MSVAGSTKRRRDTAKSRALESDDVFTKNENENESESQNEEKTRLKAYRKRGVADSLPAMELRRSKRVKSNSTLKEDEQPKDEKEEVMKKTEQKGGKKKTKIGIKHESSSSSSSSLPKQHSSSLQIKTEADDEGTVTTATTATTATQMSPRNLKTTKVAGVGATSPDTLQAKKLKSYTQFAATRQSPYPDFPHPTPSECKLAHKILTKLHGAQIQPVATPPPPPTTTTPTTSSPSPRANCGETPSVLDALVRTILSQNTSAQNSTRAKLSMDATYGSTISSSSSTSSSDSGPESTWARIHASGAAKLSEAIASGGLAATKSRAIISILAQTHARYGVYSLDHLHNVSDTEAMQELIGFKGVGPKTASCVLLFCLKRPSFAVDTHVFRIAGLLGWRPDGAAASRDLTYAHLDARVPDEDKYGLHCLFVTHGRVCEECKAGGKSLGRCELRRAFGKKGAVEGEEMKEEEEKKGDEGEEVEMIKAEEDGDDDGDVKG